METAIEVLVIWFAIYAFLRFLRGTHGKAIVTGLTVVLLTVMFFFAIFHGFETLETRFPTLAYIAENIGYTFALGVLILLQPELRHALTNLGHRPRAFTKAKAGMQRLVEVAIAARHLSERRVGALIAIERSVGLRTWAETGIQLDARVRSELLAAIFEGTTSIHDGAVIIVDDRIQFAGALLPLSEDLNIISQLGTRHRAALGLSERTDAVVVVVSEETGNIGIVVDGAFDFGRFNTGLNEEELREKLKLLVLGKES